MKRDFFEKVAVTGTSKAIERDYWLNQLAGELSKSCFPYDNPKGKRGPSPGETVPPAAVTFQFSSELCGRLKKLSNHTDPLLHIILTASIVVLLEKYSGNRDIIIGIPIYKQDIQGEFINTALAIRTRLQKNTTGKELLLQFKQTVTAACQHQNYSLETLLYKLNLPETGGDFPLFDIAVLLENIHDKNYISHIPLNMIFSFTRTDAAIKGNIEYNAQLYTPTTVERIITHFTRVMEAVLTNPEREVNRIDILSEQEKQQLLYDFNDTQQEFSREKTIPDLFQEQVVETPDNIAVVAPLDIKNRTYMTYKTYITYQELNEKANQLAHWLRKKGVKPDTLVGIMLERSIDMIIGILAVLKAGGAYLPIDPESPLKRTRSILEDANVSFLLVNNRELNRYLFTTLQGLRSSGKKPVLTPPRTPIRNFDSIPFPDRTLVDYRKYNRHIGQAMVKKNIVIQASRGCPYHCAYCHKIWPKKHVFRSAENIFNEVKFNYDRGVRKFAFVDDIFNLDRQNSMKFYEMIIKNRLQVEFYYPGGLRGDILDKEYIGLMIEAGTVNFALALETASPRLQKLIRKNLNLEKFRENIQYICKQHPQLILELFTMLGFPGETETEALMTLEFVKSLEWVHFPYINMLKIYPHTDMEKIALEHGITRESILQSENYAHYEVSDNSPLDKNFTLKYRSDFLNDYFLLKERLVHVLPFQVKILTEDELLQKYNSYLPMESDIESFDSLLQFLGIEKQELGNIKLKTVDTSPAFHFPPKAPTASPGALRILLLDLSQFFSTETTFQYDVVGEAPLGMMYLLTYLNEQFGSRIQGKIAKSRIDFDSYHELKSILEEFKPEVIGVRSLSIYKDFLHKITTLIRQWGYHAPIIAGGPYATADYLTVLQDRSIDLVVLGEGEITFSEIIREILENQNKLPAETLLQTIPGIAFIPRKSPAPYTQDREIIMMDEIKTVLARQSRENPGNINQAGDLAYAIFTSGSTGKPKGVLIQHRSVNNLVMGLKQRIYHRYPSYLRAALLSPYVFDASIKQVFGALLQGHGLYIVPESIRVDVNGLIEFFKRNRIDISDGTPTHLRLLSGMLKENEESLGVKHFIIGGEELTQKTAAVFFTAAGTPRPFITNVYGPTECTVDATSFEVAPRDPGPLQEIPIGTPMPNFEIYILNEEKQLQPVGVPGELYISGEGTARGYLNHPELTNQKFCLRRPGGTLFEGTRGLAPLLLERPGKRLYMSHRSYRSYIYRTGDLAQWLPDGNIRFLGRVDLQVKIRGVRIELGEIENCLVTHPGIKQALVLAKEPGKTGNYDEDDKSLCAYIVPEKEQPDKKTVDLSTPALREYLSTLLPDYMIPSYFISIEHIPLTPNNKIDRNALPGPGLEPGSVYTPPGNDIERKLAAIWSEVLDTHESHHGGAVGIDDDFFQLGGHSLKATIMIARVHKELDIKIPLHEIFKTPTIRGLSQYISGKEEQKFTAVPKAVKKDYYALSSAVKRLYFEQQMAPGSTTYIISALVELEGSLDRERLEKTFRQLIQRHESLRTSFKIMENEPVQEIHDQVEFEIEYYDMNKVEVEVKVEEGQFSCLEGTRGLAPLSMGPTTRSSQPEAALISSFTRPFDLSRAPLLRVGLIKKAEDRHILMVDVHHMTADGTSIGLLMKEFMTLYEGNQLPPLTLQYKDFSEWQNSLYEKEKSFLKKQEEYWLEMFKGEIPLLNLPLDFPRPTIKSYEGTVMETAIDPKNTKKLKQLAQQEDVTLYMLVLAVYFMLLSKLSGREDIVVGTPSAGRNHADLEPVIGMFVNTIALRNTPAGNKTSRNFIKEVKTQTLRAFENQDYKFEKLVEKLAVKKDLGRSPLFDVFFAFQNMEIPEIQILGLKLKPVDFETRVSRFDMGFHVFEETNRLEILVEYCTRLFKPGTINRFIKNFNEIIGHILENPDILIKDIKISHELTQVETIIPEMDLGF
jgi:amino acid adenylation domain-containing protein